MTLLAFFALVAGLSATVGLIAWSGTTEVLSLIGTLGWGLGIVAGFHLLPMLANALAWRSLLLARGVRQPWWRLGADRWLADSINALLPVASVGGEVVRGQRLIHRGVAGAVAAATIIVDLTLGLVTLAAFILAGIGLALGAGSGDRATLQSLAASALVLSGLGLLVYRGHGSALAGRLVRFMAGQVGGRAWSGLAGGAATLGSELAALTGDPAVLLRCAGWRLAGWLGGALEMMLALALLGPTIGLRDALIFEAITQAIRNLGFAVPAAVGVQEGGMVVAGSLIGLPPDLALTLSLIKRARDLLLGVPALLAWQVSAGHRLWRRRRAAVGLAPSAGDR